MKYARAILLVSFALTSTGCVLTELRVANRTGTGIFMYSGHTKELTTIPQGSTATVPHTSGKIIVLTQRDQVWQYDDVQTIVDGASHAFHRVILDIQIQPDGSIVLPTGKAITPTSRTANSERPR